VGLVVLVVACAAAIAALTGGSWESFGSETMRRKRLVAFAVLAQLVGALLADQSGAGWWYAAGLVASAVCALGFCVSNLRISGVPLVTFGLMTNALVVALNGAMPVSIFSASRAGVSILSIATGNDARHTIAGYGSRWRSLGDVIPVPIPAVPEVVSPGDVLVAAGLGEFVLVTARRKRGRESDPYADPDERQASHELSTIARRS
jgi:hypothetical protein